jgi:hypothetical protein
VQPPDWQVSMPLQTLPSLHVVPLVTTACWQPVAGLQVSLVHELPSPQLSGVPGRQVPFRQVSPPLHTLESLHVVPLTIAACAQPLVLSQVSVVHELPSLQFSGVPTVHSPAWHRSVPLHTLLSGQARPFATG